MRIAPNKLFYTPENSQELLDWALSLPRDQREAAVMAVNMTTNLVCKLQNIDETRRAEMGFTRAEKTLIRKLLTKEGERLAEARKGAGKETRAAEWRRHTIDDALDKVNVALSGKGWRMAVTKESSE